MWPAGSSLPRSDLDVSNCVSFIKINNFMMFEFHCNR